MSHPTAIGQIGLTVQDLDRAIHFYRDVLGLPLLFTAPPGLAFLDCGGVRLLLSRPEEEDHALSTTTIYYKVADLAAIHARMVAAGAQAKNDPHLIARMPDHELWMSFFDDGEGNTLGLMEERR
jgi:predicted enzyme related to lactoylglutathione lyase